MLAAIEKPDSELGAQIPPAGVTLSRAEEGRWTQAVRAREVLPHSISALVTGVVVGGAVGSVEWLRGHFDVARVLSWSIVFAISGLLQARWRERRVRSTLSTQGHELVINGEYILISELVGFKSKLEPAAIVVGR